MNLLLQKQLGQRIASLRKNRRLTQVQLAKLLDCSVDFISLVERGVNAPSVAGLEIHMIPEVRRFYSAFHDAWPYWLYFCNLDVDTLRAMTMCCLPSLNTMQVDGQTEVKVTCDPLDLLNFLKRDFMPMNLMCDRAEMFERLIYDRTKALFEYFKLPFDAPPP